MDRGWGGEVEKENGAVLVVGWVAEDGSIAIWVEAAGDGGAGREIDAEALRAAGDAAVGSNLGLSPHAPDIGPPRAGRDGPQRVALFAPREIPGGLRSGADLAVFFMHVVVMAYLVEQSVSCGEC